jgi:hypothetical protein
MVSGALEPGLVTSHEGSFDEAPEVLTEHISGGGIKTVLTTR